jgi:AraC family transcriptional regulator
MNWTEGIQKAIDYIEDNITEELDYKKIAEQAACSSYYFQKIFSVLCDMSLGEYIRNRRLALAGSELVNSGIRVIDVALKYGYSTPESFTRAFTLFHGISPTEARRCNTSLRSFSRLTVQVSLKGGKNMNYRIIEKEAFTVIEKAGTYKLDENDVVSSTIPQVWAKANTDGTIEQLVSKASEREFIYGICYGNGKENYGEETFEYSIAAVCDDDTAVPEGYRINHIPARTWLAVECKGGCPDAVQEQWREMCSTFFAGSGYTPTYEMDIEVYPNGDPTSPDYKFEIWVPVVKN